MENTRGESSTGRVGQPSDRVVEDALMQVAAGHGDWTRIDARDRKSRARSAQNGRLPAEHRGRRRGGATSRRAGDESDNEEQNESWRDRAMGLHESSLGFTKYGLMKTHRPITPGFVL